MKKTLLFLIIASFLLTFFLLGRAQFNNDFAKNESRIIFKENKALVDFSFDLAGKKGFSNDDLKGKWTLFFIGYTFCPDVCPTTLSELDRIYPILTAKPYENIQVVFVSVDPNRDKAAQLAEYVHYFNPAFIGVTSEHKQLWPFAKNLGLIYAIVDDGETEQLYMVDHSASIVLINPNGNHHASFQAVINEQGIFNVDMDLMVKDIHHIYKNWK
jgi:protein SCO1/2